jgi:preprotein translocase subunit SecG
VQTYFSIAQIVVAVVLIAVLMLQVRGGGLGGIFGQPDSVYRTRRGMERTLYRFTIALVVVFVILAVLSLQSWAHN